MELKVITVKSVVVVSVLQKTRDAAHRSWDVVDLDRDISVFVVTEKMVSEPRLMRVMVAGNPQVEHGKAEIKRDKVTLFD